MRIPGGFAELFGFVLAFIVIGAAILYGFGALLGHAIDRIRYEHRRRMDKVNAYEAMDDWQKNIVEHIGKHRAVWERPLDDQPAAVIAAVVTDLQRRRPR